MLPLLILKSSGDLGGVFGRRHLNIKLISNDFNIYGKVRENCRGI